MNANQQAAAELKIEWREDGWWITGDKFTPDMGPYKTRHEANDDMQGVKRFLRHGNNRGYIASAFAAIIGLVAASASAGTIQLHDGYQVINRPAGPVVNPPLAAHLNDFVVPEVWRSTTPQTWTWPLSEMPATVDIGLGRASMRFDDPFASLGPNKRVEDWQPQSATLTLQWWLGPPWDFWHRLEWTISGTGTVVPEPSSLVSLIVVTLTMLCVARAAAR